MIWNKPGEWIRISTFLAFCSDIYIMLVVSLSKIAVKSIWFFTGKYWHKIQSNMPKKYHSVNDGAYIITLQSTQMLQHIPFQH